MLEVTLLGGGRAFVRQVQKVDRVRAVLALRRTSTWNDDGRYALAETHAHGSDPAGAGGRPPSRRAASAGLAAGEATSVRPRLLDPAGGR